MSYMLSDGWFCQFPEQDLKTPLPEELSSRANGRSAKSPSVAGAT
jgi:hypothetical protein